MGGFLQKCNPWHVCAFVFIIIIECCSGVVKLPPNTTVPGIFAFGDSIVDQGNNNAMSTLVKCNFAPYGKDFKAGIPTGRFTNGVTPADLIAQELGIADLIPAYLDPKLSIKDLTKGVSFASGGCGYDPQTPQLVELYLLGARRIAVFGMPPIGCLPLQRTLAGGSMRMCAEQYNQAAQLVNAKLSPVLDSLTQKLPQSRIVYIDIYDPLLDIIQNPQKYGFEVSDRGCCGTGNIEVVLLCNEHSGTCADDSKYLFWDSYHPTEKGYKVLLDQIIHKYINKFQ